MKKMIKFPKTSDLETSMQSIIRLRHFFKLTVDDVIFIFTLNLHDLLCESNKIPVFHNPSSLREIWET